MLEYHVDDVPSGELIESEDPLFSVGSLFAHPSSRVYWCKGFGFGRQSCLQVVVSWSAWGPAFESASVSTFADQFWRRLSPIPQQIQ